MSDELQPLDRGQDSDGFGFTEPTTPKTQHHAHLQAARRRQELIQAIYRRGQESGVDPGGVVDAMRAADEELRRRGQHPEQIPFGNPVDDFVMGVDDYDDY